MGSALLSWALMEETQCSPHAKTNPAPCLEKKVMRRWCSVPSMTLEQRRQDRVRVAVSSIDFGLQIPKPMTGKLSGSLIS